ncbi:MAG: hypothetical protein KGZ25_01725 [Planctomycetes bacterium]|nr:hypothetical protein [Planctomycetota bacterium]
MPRIFDNIDLSLLPALQDTLDVSERADFCVGYFNLTGWKSLADYVDEWSGGDSACCRILIGMQTAPRELVRQVMQPGDGENDIDEVEFMRRHQCPVRSLAA